MNPVPPSTVTRVFLDVVTWRAGAMAWPRYNLWMSDGNSTPPHVSDVAPGEPGLPPGAGRLHRDLGSRVPGSDDQHGAGRELGEVAVVAGVELDDA